MSKRAEQATKRIHNRALLEAERYATSHGGSITEEVAYGRRFKAGFIKGYEQAEIDTIERACTWLSRYYDIDLVRFRKAILEEE